ncbi:alpha/beta hydrolase [Sandaracinobacter neustonicus]|uniref:Alpha/beta hydrolase n=1 Tax=Sandaracinobacter neustonicus TaxID=1715348 RepID=A0A501XDF8_9SPHN|nr:alpha/beta hydrolase family protein [Sandaracinobacter neustonicus]TPE58479.1 alpha/beta hydrolase [Sandaracinobacter neustonicus]
MTQFVLVHGAWQGGWCWRPVADLLRAHGHRVFTPTLTGLGERAHLLTPETGVKTHATDLLALMDCEELTDVVLVGHSYGARPTALATAHPAVRQWVSLDGVAMGEGTALFDGAPPRAMEAAEASAVYVGAKAQLPYTADILGVPADHSGFEWVNRRQTPMPWACFAEAQPTLPPRFHTLPKAYVLALGNSLAAPRKGAAEARDNGWPMPEIDSGHMLMVTAVDETADALLAFA